MNEELGKVVNDMLRYGVKLTVGCLNAKAGRECSLGSITGSRYRAKDCREKSKNFENRKAIVRKLEESAHGQTQKVSRATRERMLIRSILWS
ncbi:hypothetical protein QE152_g22702 [Popillia japonica]|uniref:Uncharacterized protein n=1 Tax=Popillia japonica TaxID=7064 RepID=A0AAW1KJM1_POPJA